MDVHWQSGKEASEGGEAVVWGGEDLGVVVSLRGIPLVFDLELRARLADGFYGGRGGVGKFMKQITQINSVS